MLRLRQAAVHPWLLDIETLEKNLEEVKSGKRKWETSTKFTKVRRDLHQTKKGGARQDEKSLVFSQFRRALDLIEVDLRKDGWVSERVYEGNPAKYKDRPRYVRIDGQTPFEQRKKAIKDFSTKPGVKLALLSLLATGVGLNLVSANNVYFLDLFFNPQVHKQAIDRTHRIGQQKNVKVHMIVIKDTIEDKISKLLEWKEGIASSTLKPVAISTDRILSLLK